MIGFLDGAVAGRWPDGCFLDVSGVGYRLSCSARTLAALAGDGARCRVWTHLHVRDDALTLYGFATEAEQSMFEGLLAVAGVGPKVALATALRLGLSVPLAIGLSYALNLDGLSTKLAIMLSSMPTAVNVTILAIEFNVRPRFVSSVVVVSTAASVFSLTLILVLLGVQ